jgi:hypothetical protein
MQEIIIKRLKAGVFDVFTENGWNNWTRVRRIGDSLRYVDGAYLNRATLNKVKERLIRK